MAVGEGIVGHGRSGGGSGRATSSHAGVGLVELPVCPTYLRSMTDTKLMFDSSGPVTTVTLNRPEVHNALDRELSAELNAAVRRVREDRECRVFVLRGAGDTFCAGDDI